MFPAFHLRSTGSQETTVTEFSCTSTINITTISASKPKRETACLSGNWRWSWIEYLIECMVIIVLMWRWLQYDKRKPKWQNKILNPIMWPVKWPAHCNCVIFEPSLLLQTMYLISSWSDHSYSTDIQIFFFSNSLLANYCQCWCSLRSVIKLLWHLERFF